MERDLDIEHLSRNVAALPALRDLLEIHEMDNEKVAMIQKVIELVNEEIITWTKEATEDSGWTKMPVAPKS
jgi:hypothetical protein